MSHSNMSRSFRRDEKHWCAVIQPNDGHDHPGTAILVTGKTVQEASELIKRDYGDVVVVKIEEADENFDADALYESLKEIRFDNPKKQGCTEEQLRDMIAFTKYNKPYKELKEDEQEDVRVHVTKNIDVSTTRGQKLKENPPAHECKHSKDGKWCGRCECKDKMKESKLKEAKCQDCGLEMATAPTCKLGWVQIEGKTYPRDTSYYDVNDRCHDCGIINKKGHFHHPGCDIERCPKCGGQNISCDCGDKEYFVSNPTVKEALHICYECAKTFRAKESICPTCKKPSEKLVREDSSEADYDAKIKSKLEALLKSTGGEMSRGDTINALVSELPEDEMKKAREVANRMYDTLVQERKLKEYGTEDDASADQTKEEFTQEAKDELKKQREFEALQPDMEKRMADMLDDVWDTIGRDAIAAAGGESNQQGLLEILIDAVGSTPHDDKEAIAAFKNMGAKSQMAFANKHMGYLGEAVEGDTPLDRFKRRRADYIKKEYEAYLQRSKEQNKKPMSEEEYTSFLFDIAMEKMGEAKVNEFGKVQAKFGSVEWQDQMTQVILTKLKNKQPLDPMEKSFVAVQNQHIIRLAKEQGIPLPPGVIESVNEGQELQVGKIYSQPKLEEWGWGIGKQIKGSVYAIAGEGKPSYEGQFASWDEKKDVNYFLILRRSMGESIEEGMAQLVTEIPGLSDKDQEILDFYFEKHGDFLTPEYNEMIKALHGVLAQGRLYFAGITKHNDPETGELTTSDKSTIASLYLLNIVLPKARKEYLGFEPGEANEALEVDSAEATDYRRKVLNFLAHPWKQPAEIEAIRTLKEFEERIRNEPVSNVQDYIKRYAIKYGAELTRSASPEFIERLRDLATGIEEAIAPVATAQTPTPASGSKTADKRQIVASDLVDKADADRIAGEKKGKVVADEKDPKKWAVEVPIQA